MFRLH